MRQVAGVALDPQQPRRVGVLTLLLDCLLSKLFGKPGEPAVPPLRIAADDRRLDDQLLPFPGRAQRAIDDRCLFLLDRRDGA